MMLPVGAVIAITNRKKNVPTNSTNNRCTSDLRSRPYVATLNDERRSGNDASGDRGATLGEHWPPSRSQIGVYRRRLGFGSWSEGLYNDK